MTNLILIPGLLCNESLYQPVIKECKNNYEIQIADVSSFKSIEDCAKAVCSNVSKDVVLVGFSFGAWVALHSYSLLQQYCKGLILISSAPGNLKVSTEQRFLHYINEISSGNFEAFIDEDYEQDISPKNKMNVKLKEALFTMMRNQGENVAINQLKALLEFKSGFVSLNEIKCPTLLIRGEDDKSLNIQKQEKMLHEIPHAKLVVIPDAAHYVPIENPAVMAMEIDSWITDQGL